MRMVRHKLISVKTWLREHKVAARAFFMKFAAVIAVLSVVLPTWAAVERQVFVRAYAEGMLVSVAPSAVIIMGDGGTASADVEIAALTEMIGEGARPDVRLVVTDIALGREELAEATASILSEAAHANRPLYLSYAIDHLRPEEWQTVATGFLYRLVRADEDAPVVKTPSVPMTFPEDVSARAKAFRGFVALASYRYAAFVQETAGKEAAVQHLLRGIAYDEQEGSPTYSAYIARRQVHLDRGGKR